MSTESLKDTFVEQLVTYALQIRGKFFIIEHVPAKVCVETGEQLFAPETVERLQSTIWGRRQPDRFLETPVFEFAGPTRRSKPAPEKRRKMPHRLSGAG